MPIITFEHKFSIGDFVSIKQDIYEYNKLKLSDKERYWQSSLAPSYMVIGIWSESCYGGLQVHYKVKQFGKEGVFISDYTEIELEAAKEDTNETLTKNSTTTPF